MTMMLLEHKTRNPYDEVRFLGETLGVGETKRGICPKCGGGQSKEASFACSKSVPGRIHFTCFRAKCSWRGTIVDGKLDSSVVTLGPSFGRKCRIFDRPTEELNVQQIEWFRDRFQISPDGGVLWCPSMGMYAYKVIGPEGQLRGWQLRDYRDGALIKASNYVHRDEPFISWYIPDGPSIGGVVVVEDIPSARKVASCGIASVALLGTALDFERAYEIGELCESFVILALDRGTLHQAINYRQKYGSIWGSVEIWQLDKDLKEVHRKRIFEALFDGKSDFISMS